MCTLLRQYITWTVQYRNIIRQQIVGHLLVTNNMYSITSSQKINTRCKSQKHDIKRVVYKFTLKEIHVNIIKTLHNSK